MTGLYAYYNFLFIDKDKLVERVSIKKLLLFISILVIFLTSTPIFAPTLGSPDIYIDINL